MVSEIWLSFCYFQRSSEIFMLRFCFFLVVFYYGIGTLFSYRIGDITDSRVRNTLDHDAQMVILHTHAHVA
jgi:hypothetical protein